ncbi:MAG: rhomboid family intramembrane serine protease [Spirochaetes bacterium]|nr:rhomboid family intramembrane serine protease [Spirochaetota bacterium]
MRVRYNSPVILSFALVSAIVLIVNQISGGRFTPTLFIVNPSFSASNPVDWLRLLLHIVGHRDWGHLISNFSFILLIGPVLEEKYGSLPILLMMLVTALATGFLNILVVKTGLYGASGIVFMLILLSSFTNIRKGEMPITFILIIALYVVREFVNALNPDTISQLAHIAGGLCGGLFGFLFARRDAAPPTPEPGKE